MVSVLVLTFNFKTKLLKNHKNDIMCLSQFNCRWVVQNIH